MSPILVRPVREQFEHDRVIRALQARYKRKYEVAINPGAEQNASVEVGEQPMYPDLVLFSVERGRKVQGTIEVETVESINTLEAMAEWAPFSRLRAPFYLYVPASSIDSVRRLCTEYAIAPAEIWTYHAAMDQVRFTMVHRDPSAARAAEAATRPAAAPSRAKAEAAKSDQPVARARSDRKAPARTAKAARKAPVARKAARPAVRTAAKKAPARSAKVAKVKRR